MFTTLRSFFRDGEWMTEKQTLTHKTDCGEVRCPLSEAYNPDAMEVDAGEGAPPAQGGH